MSDKDLLVGLDINNIKEMQEIKAKQEAGEELDPRTKEALASIEMAGNVMESIMSGKMIDLAYFKIYSARMNGKMEALDKTLAPKRKVPKNTRKYRKMMREKKAREQGKQ